MKNIIIKLIKFFVLKILYFNKKTKILLIDSLLRDPNYHIDKAIYYIKEDQLIDYNNSFYIIDIGAYNGGTSLYFRKEFPNNPIVAFEPNPKMLEQNKNTLLNQKIEILPYAVSDDAGYIQFNITNFAPSASIMQPDDKSNIFKVTEKVTIQSITLDEVFLKKNQPDILLLKIDIQGAELKALKGSIKTLQKTRLIIIEMSNHEIYKNSCKYYEIDEFLISQNFQILDLIPSLSAFDLKEYKKYNLFKFQTIEWNGIYCNLNYIKK